MGRSTSRRVQTPSGPPPAEIVIPSSLNRLAPDVDLDLIRVGRDHDGGYVVPRRLVQAADGLVSLGINDDWSFEADFMALNPTSPVHTYDHTVSETLLTRAVQVAIGDLICGRGTFAGVRSAVDLRRAFRRFFQGNVTHFTKEVRDRSRSGLDATIDTIVSFIPGHHILIKIDIEGGEYRIFPDLLRHQARLIGMVVEFHGTESLRTSFLEKVDAILNSYRIAHIHGNNFGFIGSDGVPDVLEMTFIRRDLCAEPLKPRLRSLLVGVDQPNDPWARDFDLVFESAPIALHHR